MLFDFRATYIFASAAGVLVNFAPMSAWSIEFSVDAVTGHAWGRTIQDEFAAYDACLSMLAHSSGSVYLTVVEKGCDDILVVNFGPFWQAATIKRWGSSRITYRGDHAGLFLAFPNSSFLDDFEDCCDRVLRVWSETSPAPTLEDLQDLGLAPRQKLVGGFLTHPVLADDDGTESDSSSLSSSSTNSDSTVDTVDTLSEEELAALSREIRQML